MLKKIVEGRWLQANGVLGLYPANRVGDDIEFYTDESRSQVLMTWYGLRQQTEKQVDAEGQLRPSRCLADFVAPKDSGIADYAGLFAVTAGIGSEKKEKEFLDALDDYSSIMFKSLADRLAEAFAECLHQRVRKDLWGYAADEALDNEALIKEQYQGIRPAPGYPACPDHTPKIDLFKALRTDEIGMHLTESLAMHPASSVSGFYLAHPQASYFSVGTIGDDQVQDMAQRRGGQVVINAPAHVVGIGLAPVAPPGVACGGGLRLELAVHIAQAATGRIVAEQLVHPGALFGGKTAVFLVAAPVFNVFLRVRDIDVAAQNKVPLPFQRHQVGMHGIQKAKLGRLPLFPRRTTGKVTADDGALALRRVKAGFDVAALGIKLGVAKANNHVTGRVAAVDAHAGIALFFGAVKPARQLGQGLKAPSNVGLLGF